MKVIAIDAGGSKTRAILTDTTNMSDNKEIILCPLNYTVHGRNGTKILADSILTRFNIKYPEQYFLIAGIAGAATDRSRNQIRRIFRSYGFSNNHTVILSDTELLLNVIGNNGIILIAGTGATCAGRKKLQDGNYIEARAGGYGYRFNSEPGGYSLGVKAMQRCLEIEDGILKTKSVLPGKIKDHFKIQSMREVIPSIYESKEVQKEIPLLPKLIFESAKKQDLISQELIREHTGILSSYIKAVYAKLEFDEAIVYLHGGLFKNKNSKKMLTDPLINHISLKKFKLRFKTLGIKKSDMDPLIEAVKVFNLAD